MRVSILLALVAAANPIVFAAPAKCRVPTHAPPQPATTPDVPMPVATSEMPAITTDLPHVGEATENASTGPEVVDEQTSIEAVPSAPSDITTPVYETRDGPQATEAPAVTVPSSSDEVDVTSAIVIEPTTAIAIGTNASEEIESTPTVSSRTEDIKETIVPAKSESKPTPEITPVTEPAATPVAEPPALPQTAGKVCTIPAHDDSADIGPLILDTYTTCVKPSPGATLLVPVGTHQMKSQISFNKPVPFTFRIDGKINIPYDPKLAGNMISFFLAKNIVVTGSGSIHGNGGQYRPNNDLTKHPNRPRLLRLERTHNSVVSGLHFVNAAKFHVVVMGDYNVVENIRITADYIGETDGINMSGTGNRVRNIYVKGGDECVTVKSPTTDFVAENIFCEGTAGTNIGSFGRGGTAAIDGVSYKNVTLVGGSKAGIMIKSYPSANGYIRNLKYENYKMTDAAYPISIDMNWCVPGPCESAIGDLKVENAQFSNFEVGGMPSSDADRVKSKRPLIKVACHPGKSCTDIAICKLDRSAAKGYAADTVSTGASVNTNC